MTIFCKTQVLMETPEHVNWRIQVIIRMKRLYMPKQVFQPRVWIARDFIQFCNRYEWIWLFYVQPSECMRKLVKRMCASTFIFYTTIAQTSLVTLDEFKTTDVYCKNKTLSFEEDVNSTGAKLEWFQHLSKSKWLSIKMECLPKKKVKKTCNTRGV